MLQRISGFDIGADGSAVFVAEDEPDAAPGPGAAYRWLHLDLAGEGVREWCGAHLPPLAAATLLQAETRPRCEDWGNSLIINLRGVNLNPDARIEDMVSLRIWATHGLVVTVRMRPLITVQALREAVAAGAAPKSEALMLLALAEGLTDRTEAAVLALEDRTDTLEESSISGESVATEEIAARRRAVIMLRRFAGPQREALARLAAIQAAPMAAEARALLQEVANRAARNAEALEALRERLAILQDHVDAKAGEARGQTSYILSVVAAIFLPLGFLTGLFGVNVGGMPGVESAAAFWILTLGMGALGVGMVAVFRWLRWF